ncbi:hypothetical protein [Mycolicibacterium aurum]|uniref:hypothetical protein n=1 Tax=Mycolicibacterium aurum TaxID=1791 RepID=UPI000F8443BF|nr:hypothetical protein [Mycolicibacterium aurum]
MSNNPHRLTWCLLPMLNYLLSIEPLNPSSLIRKLEAGAKWAPLPYKTPTLVRVDDGIAIWTQTNDERAIHPVIEGSRLSPLPFGRSFHVPSLSLVHSDGVRSARDELQSLIASPTGAPSLDDTTKAVLFGWINRMTPGVLDLIRRYEDLDWSSIRYVLTASHASYMVRPLLLVAESHDVPIISIPHAPHSNWDLDLPVAYPALRGPAEAAEFVQRFALNRDDLTVIGNPSSDVLRNPTPRITSDAPGVVALSMLPTEVIAASLRLLSDAGLSDVCVAPHPRTNLRTLQRYLPAGWRVHEGGRTLELLKTGPRFVIQFSSGVAWESTALGLPTAEFVTSMSARSGQFSFLEDHSIYPRIRSVDDARAFLDSVTRNEVDREKLRAHALRWCPVDGADAVAKTRNLLTLATRGKRPKRVLDGWAGEGPSWTVSGFPPTG